MFFFIFLLLFHLAGGTHEEYFLGVEHLIQQVLEVALLLPLAESSLADRRTDGGWEEMNGEGIALVEMHSSEK